MTMMTHNTDDDTNYTTDQDGNIVCNDEGYIYNPEKNVSPKEEDDDGTPTINIVRGESFDDILEELHPLQTLRHSKCSTHAGRRHGRIKSRCG